MGRTATDTINSRHMAVTYKECPNGTPYLLYTTYQPSVRAGRMSLPSRKIRTTTIDYHFPRTLCVRCHTDGIRESGCVFLEHRRIDSIFYYYDHAGIAHSVVQSAREDVSCICRSKQLHLRTVRIYAASRHYAVLRLGAYRVFVDSLRKHCRIGSSVPSSFTKSIEYTSSTKHTECP